MISIAELITFFGERGAEVITIALIFAVLHSVRQLNHLVIRLVFKLSQDGAELPLDSDDVFYILKGSADKPAGGLSWFQ